jgi:hypothetical protein
MIRSAASKVMWVGRATVFLVGLAVILALVFGAASMALGANGKPFLLGRSNVATAVSTLIKRGPGPALSLRVGANQPPMVVNSAGKVANLNADQLDGLDSSQLAPRGYAQVTTSSPFFSSATSNGVIGIVRTDSPGNVYCFDLSFTPKAAVASGNINNNATVGTVIGSGVPSGCTGEFRDAAAVTYAANDTTSAHRADLNFGIVFM